MAKRIYLLSMMVCLALAASAVTKTAVFDFSSPEALSQMGLPTPTSSTPTYLQNNITVDNITLIPGSSSPRSTFYQNQYTEHYSCISTIHHSDDTLYSSPAQLSFIVVLMIDG